MSTRRVLAGAGFVSGKRTACRWCKGPVTPPRRTFCSGARTVHTRGMVVVTPGHGCIHEHLLRSNPGYLRDAVRDRDRGVCAACGVDATTTGWQADHIIPVIEGGGECGLENMRTLCTECHKAETKALAARLAAARRTAGQDASIQTPCITCGETTEVIRGTDSIEEATRTAHCAACIANERRDPMTLKRFKICAEGGHKFNATDFETCPKCAAEKEAAEQQAATPAPDAAPTDDTPTTAGDAKPESAEPTDGAPAETPVWSKFAAQNGETEKERLDRIEREQLASMPPPKPRRSCRTLLCPMTLDELLEKREEHLEKGDELEKLERALELKEDEHRTAKKSLQSRIDTAKEEERELRKVVKSAAVEKQVWCRTEIRGSNAYVLREDTFAIVEERPATRDELQHELPFPDETINPAPAEAPSSSTPAPETPAPAKPAPADEGGAESSQAPEEAPKNDAAAALEDGAKKKRGRKAKKGTGARAEG